MNPWPHATETARMTVAEFVAVLHAVGFDDRIDAALAEARERGLLPAPDWVPNVLRAATPTDPLPPDAEESEEPVNDTVPEPTDVPSEPTEPEPPAESEPTP